MAKMEFGELDQYLFGQATHYDIYKKLGAHPVTQNGKSGTYFAVWAPNAEDVSVVGEFNDWDPERHPMKKTGPIGVWETFVAGAKVGDLYKFCIRAMDGRLLYKADPYASWSEMRPGNASRIADITGFKWGDAAWLKKRKETDPRRAALSIYEVHPGSWKKHPASDGDPDGFYSYRELAHELADYVKRMGYTHVELMGIAEHPFDGSWGYQVTGYYAPTARFGSPKEFKYLVNYLHKNKIGVILDWVPAHFPKDAHGLAEFDGTCIYEHSDPRQGEHPDWGTKIFNYGKNEVKNFLIANALYWIEEFHVDGLRVDAVASMLYLDYGKKDGQWIANKYGGNENLEAIEFFKHLNTLILGRNKGTMMIAEESTAWPKVTGDVEKENGLGFTFKWNMGWMHDFLEYMKLDPYFRKFNHNKMTFGITYATSENYILTLSHDEVVHLKCSMINKMPGEYDDKFENLKAGYSFMMGHPGKKLLFMGQEFGQTTEWNEKQSLPWDEAEKPEHRKLQKFVAGLNEFYQAHPALYEMDYDEDGFEWLSSMDADHSIITFMRYSAQKKERLLVVCNFTPVLYENFKVGVPEAGKYKEIFNSDAEVYGGSGHGNPRQKRAKKVAWDGKDYSISIEVPPLGVCVFRYIES